MTVTSDQLRDLMALGIDGEKLLAVVEIFERDAVTVASRDASRSVTVASRSKDAVRAARYRENIKKIHILAEANDAAKQTVTERDEQRDASRDGVTDHCNFLSSSSSSSSSSLSTSEVSLEKKRQVVARARGTRLLPDWQPSDEDRKFAADYAVDADWLRGEFVDFWIGVPGQRGTKLNWSATWRNRVRSIATKNGKPPQGQPPAGLMDDAEKQRLWAILRKPINEQQPTTQSPDLRRTGPGSH